MTEPLHCSFCGKSQHDVAKLIAGPTAFICDECTRLCGGIVDEGGYELLKAAIDASRIMREVVGTGRVFSAHGVTIVERLERAVDRYTFAGVSYPKCVALTGSAA